MKKESILMKIWRIVYPVGIYFLVSNVISIVFAMIMTIVISAKVVNDPNAIDILQQELTSVLYKYTMMLTAISAAITIPIVYFLFRSDRKKEQVKYKKINFALYGWIMIASFSACLGGNQLLTMSGLDKIFPRFEQVQEALYGGGIIMEVLAAVLLAPIIEEILFRGLVFKRLYSYMGRIPAMIVSSIFFGIYHGNVVQGVYAFLLGMLFVFIYDKYKTLKASILAHIMANLTSVLSVETGIFDALYRSELNFYISTVIEVIISIAVIIIMNQMVKREEIKEDNIDDRVNLTY